MPQWNFSDLPTNLGMDFSKPVEVAMKSTGNNLITGMEFYNGMVQLYSTITLSSMTLISYLPGSVYLCFNLLIRLKFRKYFGLKSEHIFRGLLIS